MSTTHPPKWGRIRWAHPRMARSVTRAGIEPDDVSYWGLRAVEATMFRSARTLLWVGITVTGVAVASAAHAVSIRPTVGVSHATTTTAASTVVTKTTVKATPAVKTAVPRVKTATTVVKPVVTVPRVPAAATTLPIAFRVQAGAARTRAGAAKLAKVVAAADPTGGYVVTGSGTTWRVVSGCRTVTDATTIKATLAAHAIASLVYKSKRC